APRLRHSFPTRRSSDLFGGTTCNPYDTSRSAGRSSGGSGAAVAASLVMCAIGEETGPSARNPAANNSLVGIVATHSLVSRAHHRSEEHTSELQSRGHLV